MPDLVRSQLIGERDLAERLGLSVSTLRWWRYKIPPEGPPVCKVGRGVRYSLDEVEKWIEEQRDPWWQDNE